MHGFNGFPNGKHAMVPIPTVFFSELLPKLDHLGEFHVTLYAFWALHTQEGEYRYLRFKELCLDETLLTGLKNLRQGDSISLLKESLERAVSRGTLLHVTLRFRLEDEDFYFMNTEKGRWAVAAIQKGDWVPGDDLRPIELIVERPNVYVKYEQNIGALTPLIVDQLKDLEKEYSNDWLDDAIEQAALNRITNLKYIINLLKRWQRDGRDAAHPPVHEDALTRLERENSHLIKK